MEGNQVKAAVRTVQDWIPFCRGLLRDCWDRPEVVSVLSTSRTWLHLKKDRADLRELRRLRWQTCRNYIRGCSREEDNIPNIGAGPGGEALGIIGDVGSQFGFPQLTNVLGGIQRGNLYNTLTTQQPFSKAAQDQVAQQVYGQLASRGVTEGGYANEAVAQAFSQEELQRQALYFQQLQAAMGLIPGASGAGGQPGTIPGLGQFLSMLGIGGPGSAGGQVAAGEGAGMGGFGGTGAGSFSSVFIP